MTESAAPSSLHPSHQGRIRFISGLGLAQIVSWGSLYYSFPLIAEPMGRELGLSKPELYGAATCGILVAGLASYPVGAAIDRGHGRKIMTVGSVLGGLLLVAWSRVSALWVFYLLFGGIGLAQAMTMYEPVFAVVTRRFGIEARRGITAITLWGGFASTVFIPFTQFAMDHVGWRNALVALGGCNLVLCIGLHAWLIDPALDVLHAKRERPVPAAPSRQAAGSGVDPSPAPLQGMRAVRWVVHRPAFWGLLVAFTAYYAMYVGLTFHLYPLLLERGFSVGKVITALSIIGPAQVAGRIAMWVFGRDRSVRAIGMVAIVAFPAGLAMLVLLPPTFATLAGFSVLCGAANGVITIVRGLVVPEMLTREAYGAINGVLALPANIAKALAPAVTAAVWALFHSYDTVLMVALVTCAVVVAAFAFAALQREPATAR